MPDLNLCIGAVIKYYFSVCAGAQKHILVSSPKVNKTLEDQNKGFGWQLQCNTDIINPIQPSIFRIYFYLYSLFYIILIVILFLF